MKGKIITLPKGTKGLLPNESYKWQYVEEAIKKVTKLYNIKEIRTPMFESTELFSRGVGESTDIVSKEMYTFEDKGGRSLTLRPEGTAGVVRSYIENGLFNKVQPIKVFYSGPVFRYEKPQKGRYREFNQFGIEYFGAKGAVADAEVIMVAVDFFKELGIKNVSININSIGTEEDRENYRNTLKEYFKGKTKDMCSDCKKRYKTNILRLIDCKVDSETGLVKNAPSILDSLSKESKEQFDELLLTLKMQNIDYKVDDKIIRGIDYYTGTVFEVICEDIEGPSKVIAGGGRYDNLVESLGGKTQPAIGFGIGLERVIGLMEEFKVEIPKEDIVDLYVINNTKGTGTDVFIANELRKLGLICEIDIAGRSQKSLEKYLYKIKQNIKGKLIVDSNIVDVVTGKIKSGKLTYVPYVYYKGSINNSKSEGKPVYIDLKHLDKLTALIKENEENNKKILEEK